MAKLESIEGIGETYAEKLRSIGVKTIEALLEKGATPNSRPRRGSVRSWCWTG